MANRRGKRGSSERFSFIGLQNTADSDYSHEIKRHLLIGRKAMTNLDTVLKSRGITLVAKVKYGCDIWTIKKAEHQSI